MKKTELLITTAIFTAMITMSILYMRIPIATMGMVHLGDSIIFLAACVLPKRYAVAAAGVGGALANLIAGVLVFAPFTLVIKALIVLPLSAKNDRILTAKNALMLLPAGVITIVGYGLVYWLLLAIGTVPILFGETTIWGAITAGTIGNAVQVLGSSVIFIVIAFTLDRIKFKQRFMRAV